MSIRKIALATAGMALLGASPMVSMASAQSVRPAAVTSFAGAPIAKAGVIRRGSRVGKSAGEQSSLFGLGPVVIAILTSIVVAVTVVVATDGNNSTSP